MILTIALLCSIIGGVVGYVIARCVVGKWISSLVLEKLQGVIDDFEYTNRKD
jgi:membrane protein YqaA with SNARE-associated domain